MILLVADILELKASTGQACRWNSAWKQELDKSRGPIATVFSSKWHRFMLGDVFVAGAVMGRVRAMFDDLGQ